MRRRTEPRRSGRPGPPRRAVLRIAALGAQGDGIGELDGRPVYVGGAAAGDLAEIEITGSKGDGLAGRLARLLEPASGRATPVCEHFGSCGGCATQHLSAQTYVDWKSGLLPAAMARRGLTDLPIRPLLCIPPGTRRRAALAAQRRGKTVQLGFHARSEHRVVDLSQCAILLPRLVGLLAPLRAALLDVLPQGGTAELLVTETETGTDLLVVAGFEPGLAARQALASFAEAQDLARVSWSHPGSGEMAEPVALRRAPVLRFGVISVTPPPGPFLQPSAEGEAALAGAVREAVGEARVIADLYAGCGTFSLRLAAAGARVHAVDTTGPALAALQAAARQSGLGAVVATERRDLDERPLTEAELGRFDAVVFDPPRAGARAQAEVLARSAVPRLAAVSCNPATFARDARLLVDGGYRLEWIQPVDQFPWTRHLELVACFSR